MVFVGAFGFDKAVREVDVVWGSGFVGCGESGVSGSDDKAVGLLNMVRYTRPATPPSPVRSRPESTESNILKKHGCLASWRWALMLLCHIIQGVGAFELEAKCLLPASHRRAHWRCPGGARVKRWDQFVASSPAKAA